MREERSDLRAQLFLLEREKHSMELYVGSQNAQEAVLKSHIQHLLAQIENADHKVSGAIALIVGEQWKDTEPTLKKYLPGTSFSLPGSSVERAFAFQAKNIHRMFESRAMEYSPIVGTGRKE